MKIDLEELKAEFGTGGVSQAAMSIVNKFLRNNRTIVHIIYDTLNEVSEVRRTNDGYMVMFPTLKNFKKRNNQARLVEAELRKAGKDVVLVAVSEQCFILRKSCSSN